MLPLLATVIQLACVSLAGSGLQAVPRNPEAPIFRFEADEFWLNLHHFLYVLGRAEAKTADASREAVAGAPADEARGLDTLTSDERRAWREAVTFYAAGPSRKDLIFDGPLSAITQALADADAAASLSGMSGVPAADALGVRGRGFQSLKAPIEETWRPYLDGRGTRDEALAALVAKTATALRR